MAAALGCALLPVSTARGHGLTPHPNNPVTILWEQDGVEDGNTNHNHTYDHSLVFNFDEGTHHSHRSFAAWHNRTYLTNVSNPNNYAHGFIEENSLQPRYSFTAPAVAGITALPAAGQAIVNAGFDLWESRAHEVPAQLPGRRTGIDFDNNNTNFEFRVLFADNLIECRGALGEWIFRPSQLLADTQNGCPVALGVAWTGLTLANGPFLLFDDDTDWAFLALTSAVNPGAAQFDFATIALHEEGHAIGLGHTPASADSTDFGDSAANHIMRRGIANQALGTFFRQIEFDSAVGAKELYTVVPEPTTLMLLLIGGAGLFARRRWGRR